jgi:hypothetical protein
MDHIDISLGKHRQDKTWKTEYLSWEELVERFRKVRRTPETMSSYDAMSKADRGKVKDGPSFVGGLLRGGRRKKENVDNRTLITLDADTPSIDFPGTVELMLGGTAYFIYSTHSHRESAPKYRLVIPVDRAMSVDEYAAVSRRVAEWIGMDNFDGTTFHVHRLMYFPSCSKDADPVSIEGEGVPLVVDDVLETYEDALDVLSWPRHPNEGRVNLNLTKAQDPREKFGAVGLFCRAFTIEEGIETFLTDQYDQGSMPGRYTYLPGTSGNGLEVYPEQDLAFSHQDSDPVSDGRTHNLFDLVRIHLFGEHDEGIKDGTPDAKRPSFDAMCIWVMSLPEVKRLAAMEDFGDEDFEEDGEGVEQAEDERRAGRDKEDERGNERDEEAGLRALLGDDEDSGGDSDSDRGADGRAGGGVLRGDDSPGVGLSKPAGGASADGGVADPKAWAQELERHSKTGALLPTAGNVELLLNNGKWKGTLAYDGFGNREVIKRALPWRDRRAPDAPYEPWLGEDDDRRNHWFAKVHGIANTQVIKQAFTEVTRQHRFHPIIDYLEAQKWDGVGRLERLFIDYLGAEDSDYTRCVTKKMFIAAVKRLYEPGCKFDNMLVLIGPQGAHKSTILQKMGMDWFSDSLKSLESKEAGEHLQSAWLFEFGELAGMNRVEVEEIKQFLSKRSDKYRVAYDRTVSDFPRKCVFFGTTNNHNFLKDATGNRRFWPVPVDPSKRKLNVFDDLNEEIGLLWAEAVAAYRSGESLEPPAELAQTIAKMQAGHVEKDDRVGMIEEWMDEERTDDKGFPMGITRDRTCAIQVWVECFGKRQGDMRPADGRTICELLRSIEGWREVGRVYFPGYGKQAVFERIEQ